jgi:hypothetical protein
VRKLVTVAAVLSILGLVAAGCGGDDEEPTTTSTTTLTGASGVSGASGASGAAGADVSQIEQTLEDAGFTVEKADAASLTVTLPSAEIKAEEKLDVDGGGLSSTAFITEYADEADATTVQEQYEEENILPSKREGAIVFSAPTDSDLDLLIDAAKGD